MGAVERRIDPKIWIVLVNEVELTGRRRQILDPRAYECAPGTAIRMGGCSLSGIDRHDLVPVVGKPEGLSELVRAFCTDQERLVYGEHGAPGSGQCG